MFNPDELDVECKNCGKKMERDSFFPNLLNPDRNIRHFKENDGIEQWSENYICPNCETEALIIRRAKVEELMACTEWKDPEPKTIVHMVDSISEVPDEVDRYAEYYIKKGYYDYVFPSKDGIEWKYSRGANREDRCEDCIYFMHKFRLIEECKLKPNPDGSPNGTCAKGFRIRDKCPIFDKGYD